MKASILWASFLVLQRRQIWLCASVSPAWNPCLLFTVWASLSTAGVSQTPRLGLFKTAAMPGRRAAVLSRGPRRQRVVGQIRFIESGDCCVVLGERYATLLSKRNIGNLLRVAPCGQMEACEQCQREREVKSLFFGNLSFGYFS